MLRITMNKSAAAAKKYYCERYYQEGRSEAFGYYAEGEQAIGRWGGKAAEKLGLNGSIDKKDFAMLCDNISPLTGQRLTGRNDTNRTVGYDFTFNASKSVSLAYAFADEADKKTILDAFQSAVRSAMTEVESGMQARVRTEGKNENRLTGNIAYGEFTHFTTRPIDGIPDPHLHSHCFVLNATHDEEDGQWKAGQFRQVKQDAPYYEAFFHAKLAQELKEAGYGIEQTKNGFELAGLEKSTLEKFSRRTQEIEEYAKEHEITNDEEKSRIGAKTREAKRAEAGIDPATEWSNRLTQEERNAFENLKQEPNSGEDESAAKQAIQFSLDHHMERKSVASDKEILATAMKSAIGEASPEQINDAFKQKDDVLSVTEDLKILVSLVRFQLIPQTKAFRFKL